MLTAERLMRSEKRFSFLRSSSSGLSVGREIGICT